MTSRKFSSTGLSAALAALVFLFAYSSTASALVIYDWTGECTAGCTGTAHGTMVLEDSYVPGTEIQFLSDFVSWAYSSDTLSYAVDLSLPDSNGTLPANMGTADVFLDLIGLSNNFATFSVGSWQSVTDGGVGADATHNWALRTAAVPEPATLLLFGLGLLGIGAVRKQLR